MSTATIIKLPVTPSRRRAPRCTNTAKIGNTDLFCIRDEHPADPWCIDPVSGEFQTLLRRTEGLIA